MKILKAFSASVLIHVCIFLTFYGLILMWKNSALSVVDIDLSGSTLMLRPASKANSIKPSVESFRDWFISTGKKLAAIPDKITTTAVVDDSYVNPCPAPCPENTSDWAAAGSTSRRPVWAQGFITEDDYPKDARAQGKEGRVKVDIFLDAQGVVRDARIIQSSDDRFSAVVLEKLKKARFEPALDLSGRPVAVHMAIPIAFELH